LLAAGALIVALLLDGIALTVVAPHAPYLALPLHPIVQALTVHLILAATGCVILGLRLRRNGSPKLGSFIAAQGAMSVVAFLAALIVLLRAGSTRGIRWAFSEAIAPGYQSGTPDEARSEIYGDADGIPLKLDVWIPRRGQNSSSTPAVVWLHGGGFVRGARGATPRWNEWLNERGYAVFDADYRLAPPASWDQAPRDVDCVLGWIAMNATRYHVDPARVVVVGESAGATLALLSAYGTRDGSPRRECEARKPSVAAVIAFYPVIDVREFWSKNTVFGSSRRWSELFTGGTPSDVPQRYESVSPLGYVRAGVPPTLIVQGLDDNVVYDKSSLALDGALSRAGVDHELLGLPQTDHGFDHFWGSLATQIARHTFNRFLGEHLAR
jgi:acetyl esterase/lipase